MPKHSLLSASGRSQTTAALVIAAAAAWRLPRVFGLAPGSTLFAGSVLTLVLACGLFCLMRQAFLLKDQRLLRIAGLMGFLFACVTVVGADVKANNGFGEATWLSLVDGMVSTAAFTFVYGAALALVFHRGGVMTDRASARRSETWLSKVTGHYLFVFVLLVLCWIPAWLACWPGIFTADSVTQFWQYYNEDFNTHHPLLHTLLLGFCMVLGIDNDPMGDGAAGVALYTLVQMVLLAAMLAYGCHWMRKRGAPLWARLFVTFLFALFPFYSLWALSDQKDILFGGLVMLMVLQLVDLWREDFRPLRRPLWLICFILITVLMTLMRNNGIYALCLFLPFGIGWARGCRIRMAGLLAGCIVLYLAAGGALAGALEAGSGSPVEMFSIPLQQLARTVAKDANAIAEDDQDLLEEMYPNGFSEYYYPMLSDPLKWAVDNDIVEERWAEVLGMWARVGIRHPDTYIEAFLVQNLPYILPGADMIYKINPEVLQIDMIPITEHSFLPRLRAFYEAYDDTLTIPGVPLVRLLSDTAFYVWICMSAIAYSLYRRQRHWIPALLFLLAIWATCLLGPVALMRYMLGFFYALPILLAAMMAPAREANPSPREGSGAC